MGWLSGVQVLFGNIKVMSHELDIRLLLLEDSNGCKWYAFCLVFRRNCLVDITNCHYGSVGQSLRKSVILLRHVFGFLS